MIGVEEVYMVPTRRCPQQVLLLFIRDHFYHSRILKEYLIGLLHKHWFLIEEGGWGGIGWQLQCFLNATESCSTVHI